MPISLHIFTMLVKYRLNNKKIKPNGILDKDMSDKYKLDKDVSDKYKLDKDVSDKDFIENIEINIDNDLGFVYNKRLDNLHKKREENAFPKQDVKYGSIPNKKNI